MSLNLVLYYELASQAKSTLPFQNNVEYIAVGSANEDDGTHASWQVSRFNRAQKLYTGNKELLIDSPINRPEYLKDKPLVIADSNNLGSGMRDSAVDSAQHPPTVNRDQPAPVEEKPSSTDENGQCRCVELIQSDSQPFVEVGLFNVLSSKTYKFLYNFCPTKCHV